MAREPVAIRYGRHASKALKEQARYYENRSRGLGQSFLDCVHDAEQFALSNPTGFREIDKWSGIRAIVIRRFPFRLLYAVRQDAILVVAITHTARKPDDRYEH